MYVCVCACVFRYILFYVLVFLPMRRQIAQRFRVFIRRVRLIDHVFNMAQ